MACTVKLSIETGSLPSRSWATRSGTTVCISRRRLGSRRSVDGLKTHARSGDRVRGEHGIRARRGFTEHQCRAFGIFGNDLQVGTQGGIVAMLEHHPLGVALDDGQNIIQIVRDFAAYLTRGFRPGLP